MKRQISLKTAVALVLCASALTCVLLLGILGLYLGVGSDLFGEIRTYIELRRDIEDAYIGDYDSKKVSETALAASVAALEDQWSYYLTPEQYSDYLDASNNQYTGLGISVQKNEETGGLMIMSVYVSSPAEKAGIKEGDIITAVDKEDITELAFEEAVGLIDRKFGQTIRLDVLHSDGTTAEIAVEYGIIETKSVSYELLDERVGYIKIRNFEAGTSEGFIEAADTLIAKGADAFVFDVRNNGGGRVSELKAMLDYLLPACEIFVSVDKSGVEAVSLSDADSVTLPAVVLVNSRSYSAAEYFAVCLQEYSYATVIGEQTTGKNRSQITLPLPDGGALHISSGEYLTPNRVSLTEQGGITPDIESVLSDEDNMKLYNGQLDTEMDSPLQEAIDFLKQS